MVLMGRARQIKLFAQPSANDEEAARAALDRFGMLSFASRAFHELSGGELQLVIFARAVVSQPSILILDEPTSALDLKNQHLILHWLTRFAHEDGLTVLFTTHNPNHALAIADQALLIFGESQYVCGATRETLNESNLQTLYGVDMKLLPFNHQSLSHEAFVPILPLRPSAKPASHSVFKPNPQRFTLRYAHD